MLATVAGVRQEAVRSGWSLATSGQLTGAVAHACALRLPSLAANDCWLLMRDVVVDLKDKLVGLAMMRTRRPQNFVKPCAKHVSPAQKCA